MAQQNIWVDLNMQTNVFANARFESVGVYPTSPAVGRQVFYTADNTFRGWDGSNWINLSQIVSSPSTIKGEITNADTNPAYPASPTVGDSYFVTTNAGTIGSKTVEIGDLLVYSNSGWFILQANLQQATASIYGYVRYGTQSEVNALSLTNVALSPGTLGTFLSSLLYTRKVSTAIATLTANTPFTVTHGLGLIGVNDLVIQNYQGGSQIQLEVKPVTANTYTVQSNVTISTVQSVAIG